MPPASASLSADLQDNETSPEVKDKTITSRTVCCVAISPTDSDDTVVLGEVKLSHDPSKKSDNVTDEESMLNTVRSTLISLHQLHFSYTVDVLVEFKWQYPKEEKPSESSIMVRLDKNYIVDANDAPGKLDYKAVDEKNIGDVATTFKVDTAHIDHLLKTAADRQLTLFVLDLPYRELAPSRNLFTSFVSHGPHDETVACMRKALSSSGVVHALISVDTNLDYLVTYANQCLSDMRVADPLDVFYKNVDSKRRKYIQLGLTTSKAERPPVSVAAQIVFASWHQYRTACGYAVIEEQEVEDRRATPRDSTAQFVEVHNSEGRQYFAFVQHDPMVYRFSEGDPIGFVFDEDEADDEQMQETSPKPDESVSNSADKPDESAPAEDPDHDGTAYDVHKAGAWYGKVVASLPGAPHGSVCVLLNRKYDKTKKEWDAKVIPSIDMADFTTLENTRDAISNAPDVHVVYFTHSDRSLTRRKIKALWELDYQQNDLRWARDTLLGHRIDEQPLFNFFANITGVEQSLAAMEFMASRLNDEQASAVKMVERLPNGVGLIQGPPGTGKTFLLANMLQPLLFSIQEKKETQQGPIALLLSTTNLSVDDMVVRLEEQVRAYAEKLSSPRTFCIVRLHTLKTESAVLFKDAEEKRDSGRPRFLKNPINQDLQDFAVAKSFAETYSQATAQPHGVRDKRLKQVENSLGKLMLDISGFVESDVSKEYGDRFTSFRMSWLNYQNGDEFSPDDMAAFTMAESDLRDAALKRADVIVTTIARANDRVLCESIKPQVIAIDEAARATEADLWGVFAFYPRGPKIFIGDSRQLRPIASRSNPWEHQMTMSVMTRLQLLGYPFVQLAQQRRSVKAISELTSTVFYNQRLTPDVDVNKLLAPESLMFMNTLRLAYKLERNRALLLFSPIVGQSELLQASGSAFNTTNVRIAMDAVLHLLAGGIDPTKITILVPYIAQQAVYKNAKVIVAEKDNRVSSIGIETIESVQGREFDFVIVDFVRTDGAGFLKQKNRVNVATSRARFGMIVIINGSQLRTDRFFDKTALGKVYDYMCKSKKGIVRVTEKRLESFVEIPGLKGIMSGASVVRSATEEDPELVAAFQNATFETPAETDGVVGAWDSNTPDESDDANF